ncbi:hypothetical protein D0Z08_07850 [Nocardioides immobilis]|uniref:SWIM-type domain-containing protein n=1 Tax=Nocardioides immobilis TaxID=2049295 RepID=A0A417Y4T4_9ACTN|nr:DUF6880 family protein [Nocardioides immobilis]RHW27586.1 hypothetical protein D0Z08_07850 [Nocardioides immobilis]
MPEQPNRTFRRMFSRRELESLAGRRTFERGHDYALDGRVHRLKATSEQVDAKVRGSASYQVRLWIEDEEAAWACTCPVGREERFCKHAVAVGLVAAGSVEPEHGDGNTDEVNLADYVADLDHQALVDMLLERAAADDLFDARLRAAAASKSGGRPDLTSYRQALAAAFETDGYVDYREAYDYTTGIRSVLNELQLLLDEGHSEDVMALSEYAADLAEEALGFIDDSDGGMSLVAEQLRDLHLTACEQARPEPITLAHKLYERERHGGDLEVFYGALETYADVLGEVGLAEYRRLAQAEWDELSPLGPGDSEHTWSSGRFHLTLIMLSLADLSGDVDTVVEVLAHDQSSAYQFVKIAEALQGATRHDEALDWALMGLSLHGYHDHRLVELVAQEHHRVGRSDDAVAVVWRAFEESPGVETYRRLKEHAERTGLWPERHDRALALLRKHTNNQRDRSLLVAILLLDGEVDQAWAEAIAGGCRRDQWLELARRREDDHPDDAIPLWREEVTREIAAMSNPSYANAVALIERIGRLMPAAGRGDEFASYVAGLATEHRRKRNLMKLFAERGW